MGSDGAWKVAHRSAAPLMIVTGAVGLLLGVVIGVVGLVDAPIGDSSIILNSYLGFMVVMIIAILVVAERAVTRLHSTGDPSKAPWDR